MQIPSFLIVPDSFKDCLNAEQVGYYIEKGINKVYPQARTKVIPMADGGEGTVLSIVKSQNGKLHKFEVLDPLGRKTEGFIGTIDNDQTAIIEMAAASGIEKLSKQERNPWLTSTYGTGQLIAKALDLGCVKIIVGIGGSATNDGGVGMAKALGISFLNKSGNEIKEGGGALSDLHEINMKHKDKRLDDIEIIAATDVTSPLTGPRGASYVYGPQKGANIKMVQELDSNLIHLSKILKEQLHVKVDELSGAGAAGGLGAGLFAFLNANLQSGLNTIVDIVGLENAIKSYDIIITAEGKVDGQTSSGKTPIGIARISKKHKKPVFVFTGAATTNTEKLYDNGISSVIPITRKPVSLDAAISNAPKWLEKSSEELCKIISSIFFIK